MQTWLSAFGGRPSAHDSCYRSNLLPRPRGTVHCRKYTATPSAAVSWCPPPLTSHISSSAYRGSCRREGSVRHPPIRLRPTSTNLESSHRQGTLPRLCGGAEYSNSHHRTIIAMAIPKLRAKRRAGSFPIGSPSIRGVSAEGVVRELEPQGRRTRSPTAPSA